MDGFLAPVVSATHVMTTDGNTTLAPTCLPFPYVMTWWLKALYTLGFAAVTLVAAGGNFIVIWIVLFHKQMRNATNIFLVNLAVADSLISLTNTPFNAFYMILNNWPFGSFYCKASTTLNNATIAASTFTFMAIAIER